MEINYDFDKYMHKKIGNLYLSDAEMEILNIFNIDYKKYNDIKSLTKNLNTIANLLCIGYLATNI